ncbi:hypothetical protein ABK040_001265 [Willaertia magna]
MVNTGISVGRRHKRGFPTTKRPQPVKVGKATHRKLVKDIVEEAVGILPYEARLMDLVELSEKRALKFAKKRLGDITRAKKKIKSVEEMKRRLRRRNQERQAEQQKLAPTKQ